MGLDDMSDGIARLTDAGSAAAEIAQVLDVEAVLAANSIRTAFQPICNLRSREVIGYEALARFPGSDEVGPTEWFLQASRLGLLQVFELSAIAHALLQVPLLPAEGFVAVNISPATAASKAFRQTLSSVPPRRLVLEIAERALVDDYEQFSSAIEFLRSIGVRIALDDAGGAADIGLQHLVLVKPDLLKIDTTVIHGIAEDEMRQAVVSAYANLAERAGAIVIAEGIETQEELDVLLSIGVEVGQGYLLGYPMFLGQPPS
jgi:EAL domain-containing protein (putative c-di-GMP-specific phosphodiesterase class I)